MDPSFCRALLLLVPSLRRSYPPPPPREELFDTLDFGFCCLGVYRLGGFDGSSSFLVAVILYL